MLAFFRQLEPCLIGLEACSGAHYWARELGKLGHDVRLMAPQFVKPYVKGGKNDANDAEAICEAVGRPTMRFVPIKTIEQQDMQCEHRLRNRLIKARTALSNEIRGMLAEFGIVVRSGLSPLRRALPNILEDAGNGLSGRFRQMLCELAQELRDLDERIKTYDQRLQAQAREDERVKRLLAIEGMGPVVATALVAAVGDGKSFASGRDLSAWLGLLPSQHSSGGKNRLGRISKRGDTYLRTLLIHGARAAVCAAGKKTDRRSRWINALVMRRNKNIATVALANKNARIAWAMLRRNENYCMAA